MFAVQYPLRQLETDLDQANKTQKTLEMGEPRSGCADFKLGTKGKGNGNEGHRLRIGRPGASRPISPHRRSPMPKRREMLEWDLEARKSST